MVIGAAAALCVGVIAVTFAFPSAPVEHGDVLSGGVANEFDPAPLLFFLAAIIATICLVPALFHGVGVGYLRTVRFGCALTMLVAIALILDSALEAITGTSVSRSWFYSSSGTYDCGLTECGPQFAGALAAVAVAAIVWAGHAAFARALLTSDRWPSLRAAGAELLAAVLVLGLLLVLPLGGAVFQAGLAMSAPSEFRAQFFVTAVAFTLVLAPAWALCIGVTLRRARRVAAARSPIDTH